MMQSGREKSRPPLGLAAMTSSPLWRAQRFNLSLEYAMKYRKWDLVISIAIIAMSSLSATAMVYIATHFIVKYW